MSTAIPRATIEELFAEITAKTDWDLRGNMCWGYFFSADDPDRLAAVRVLLEADGYRFVDLFAVMDDDTPTGEFTLHVERHETHSVDTLVARNGALEAFAAQHGLDRYDGMDVGPIARGE